MTGGWSVAGSYLEACNCDPICPCRRVGERLGGRSTHGVCMGALSWSVRVGMAGSVDLSGLAVVLAFRYDDDEPASPWDHWLFVDERGGTEQRAALEQIFLGRASGSALEHFPWAWKDSRLLGVSPGRIEIDHAPGRGWFRVRDRVTVRVSSVVSSQQPVTCVVPGHDRAGRELVAAEITVAGAGSLAFDLEDVCAYESTFAYAGGWELVSL
jgi:hypothetical protein